MKRNSRIMTIWAAMILLWTCCIVMTCLFLSDVMCMNDDLCYHVDDVMFLENNRMMGSYKEIYDYVPVDYIDNYIKQKAPHGSIVLYNKLSAETWDVPLGDSIFRQLSCPVSHCVVTDNITAHATADVIVLHASDVVSRDDMPSTKPINQRWLLYMMEPPDHLQTNLSVLNGLINWTSTYSTASDLPLPFGAYTQNEHIELNISKIEPSWGSEMTRIQTRNNYTRSDRARHSSMVAMFTNSCTLPTGHKQYVHELNKHLSVHLYGPCRHKSCGTHQQCLDMLRTKYKFYLAFEESNCNQYITDIFWHVALQHDVIPVVMGAPRLNYEQVAPPHSFIHVNDFDSPADLAKYIKEVDANSTLYLQYFQWKSMGYVSLSGQIKHNFQFWCGLCAKLHNKQLANIHQVYLHLDKWWDIRRQCHTDHNTFVVKLAT